MDKLIMVQGNIVNINAAILEKTDKGAVLKWNNTQLKIIGNYNKIINSLKWKQ